MLIHELKFKILEYIFAPETVNYLYTNKYSFKQRDLHTYTLKAFKEQKANIAKDLIENDIYDLNFSFKYIFEHKGITRTLNILSYCIYKKFSENIFLKVIKSNTCDLHIRDEYQNTFLQIIYTKFKKYTQTINYLIENADSFIINNKNNLGKNIMNMDFLVTNIEMDTDKKFVIKIFENVNYNPNKNKVLFKSIINRFSTHIKIRGSWMDIDKLLNIYKYVYNNCPFRNNLPLTENSYIFYYDVAEYFSYDKDCYDLIMLMPDKLQIILDGIKFIALKYGLDNGVKDISTLIYKINLNNLHYYSDNNYRFNLEFFKLNFKIGLKNIQENLKNQEYINNGLVLAYNTILSNNNENIKWVNYNFLPIINNLTEISKFFLDKNILQIIIKLIELKLFDECLFYIEKYTNFNSLPEYYLFDELYEEILIKSINKDIRIADCLINKNIINCKVTKTDYWTEYNYIVDKYAKFKYIFNKEKIYNDLDNNTFTPNQFVEENFKSICGYSYYSKEYNVTITIQEHNNFILNKILLVFLENKKFKYGKKILKYIDFTNENESILQTFDNILTNNHDEILFEIIKINPGNFKYFQKTNNFDQSIYSYCVANNFEEQINLIINSISIINVKKLLFRHNAEEKNFSYWGATIDDFYWACYHSNIKLIEFYLDNQIGKYNYEDSEGFTPLMYLSINKLENLAIKLFETNLSSSTKLNKLNKSALHYSIDNELEILANILYNELVYLVKNK